MTYRVTFTDGTVVNHKVSSNATGRAFYGVLKTSLAQLTDRLRNARTIGPDDTIVNAVASGKLRPVPTYSGRAG